eukprot:TRINITY_DN7181_c0_g1_i1.p1 TRINITY_DN7181_c0_g1~~TRINITY_DN7181_c0_g1_i1.p1  ORF type:complete len:161 (-),score=39.65 TRINITY_DN7181_c0_g1_i1:79-534(-)
MSAPPFNPEYAPPCIIPSVFAIIQDKQKIRLKGVNVRGNLRILQNGECDMQGGTGVWATYTVHKVGTSSIKLQNIGDDRHYLRIAPDFKLDGIGTGGKWTIFEIVNVGPGTFFLQSEAHKQEGRTVFVAYDGAGKPVQNASSGFPFVLEIA